jgi:D-alanyl-D-alanine dipeptidase
MMHGITRFAIATALALATFAPAADAAGSPGLPPPLAYLRLVDPTIAQDIRYATANNFTGRPLPGYDASECVLHRAAAQALAKVQADLAAAHLALKVYDCYRPERAVRAMAAWSQDGKNGAPTKRFFPHIDKRNLFALGYIARYSRHSSGTAVDLTLIEKGAKSAAPFDPATHYGACDGPLTARAPDNSIDMGTGYDCLDPKGHTATSGVTLEQHNRRMMLVAAMRKRGFSNYRLEWWHFTFDGTGGARHYDVPIAPIGR